MMWHFANHRSVFFVVVLMVLFTRYSEAMNQRQSLAVVPYDEKNKALVPYHHNILLKRLLKKRLNDVLNKRKSKNSSGAAFLDEALLKQWRFIEQKVSPACQLFNDGDFMGELHNPNSLMGIVYQLFCFESDFLDGLFTKREFKTEVYKFLKGKKQVNFDVLLPLAEKLQLPKHVFSVLLSYLYCYPGINDCGEKAAPGSPRKNKIIGDESEITKLEDRPLEYVLWDTAVGNLKYGRFLNLAR